MTKEIITVILTFKSKYLGSISFPLEKTVWLQLSRRDQPTPVKGTVYMFSVDRSSHLNKMSLERNHA